MIAVYLLGFITLAVCVSQALSFRRLCTYVKQELKFRPGSYCPRAAVILPCKGIDPGFRDNIVKLLDQDYGKDPQTGVSLFEVIFAVATQDDPAYPVLAEVCRSSKSVPTKIVVAGVNAQRAQKINNQLRALKEVGDDVEVLVFVDSDVIARRDFLRYLVAHLDDSRVGATTGYRFYIASRGDWPSVLRGLWNRMSAWELASPRLAFAWGGAMAIRKSTFEQAGVASSWDKAADDDLSLTTAVRALGLKVHFVPQCLVASDGDGSLSEIIEWTNRQLILTKVYFPGLWRRAILRAGIMALWLITVTISAILAALSNNADLWLAVLIGLCVLPVELLFLLRAQGLWREVLSDRSQYIDQSFLTFCLAVPLAHLVLPWMTLYSLLTNRIQWRGITYELRSPTETLVVSNF